MFKYQISFKNPSNEAELFHADGWTDRRIDMMKLIVDFRTFLNASITLRTEK